MPNQLHSVSAHDRLIGKLDSIAELTDADRHVIRSLPLKLKTVPPKHDIVDEGDRPSHCCLLVHGFVSRSKTLSFGQRQIVSIHVPGDVLDLQSLHLTTMDHSLDTLVTSDVAFIPHAAIYRLVDQHPRIAHALWRDTLIDASIFREWVVNVGARPADQRIAHLLCELFEKLRAVGLASERGFTLPLSQAKIGEATGLSTVHVNRTLQGLRARNLISSRSRFPEILDYRGLQEAAGFDPSYMHLVRGARTQANA